jgi:polyhydroxyalkanoate synthesis regulator phasin
LSRHRKCHEQNPLVQVLVKKGVLSAEEARLIAVNATPAVHGKKEISRG